MGGRLLGYVRVKWARALGIDHACVAILKGLPEGAQMQTMVEFDAAGTKDGNVTGRFSGYLKKVCAVNNLPQPPSFGGASKGNGKHMAAMAMQMPMQRSMPAYSRPPTRNGPGLMMTGGYESIPEF